MSGFMNSWPLRIGALLEEASPEDEVSQDLGAADGSVPPQRLVPGEVSLQLTGEPSALLTPGHARALAGTLPTQDRPEQVYYPWRQPLSVRNNFFQYSTINCLAVGSLGTFAIYLDSQLKQGMSFWQRLLAGQRIFG
eukprot:gene30665-35683_t